MEQKFMLTHDGDGEELDNPIETVVKYKNSAIEIFFPNSKWDDNGMARVMVEICNDDLRVVVWEHPDSDEYRLVHILPRIPVQTQELVTYTQGDEGRDISNDKEMIFIVPYDWLESKIKDTHKTVDDFLSDYTYDDSQELYWMAKKDGVIL